MKIAWRRIVKLVLAAVGALCVVFLLQISSLGFPQPLFGHKLVSASLTAYSDEEFDETLKSVVAEVEERLAALEIRDPGLLQRVYLCRNPKLYRFFTSLALVPKQTMGFNLSVFENSYISRTRIEEVRCGNVWDLHHTFLEGNLAQVIGHEVTHAHTEEKLGFRRYRVLPKWKSEGYAEYVSTIEAIRKDSRHPLQGRIGILLDDSIWKHSVAIRKIYQAQLLVEFLSEVKGLSFDEIMSEQVTEEETLEEMKRWVASL